MYSPVSKDNDTRLLLAVSVHCGSFRNSFHVKLTFQYRLFNEEIYIDELRQFQFQSKGKYNDCVQKALFGMKQASRK